jgi:DNA-binding MarR family transcriptional regulator
VLPHPVDPSAALCVLLGQQRAFILHCLHRPMTPGELAQALAASPSRASYHLDVLQRADLIARARWGRRLLVHRTPRGVELLRLFDEA